DPRLQRRLDAVERPGVEAVIRQRAEQACHALASPYPVGAIAQGIVPDFTQLKRVRRQSKSVAPANDALRPCPELQLDALVRIDAQQPVGAVAQPGGNEPAVVADLVPVRTAARDADELQHLGAALEELQGPVR